jgi:UDP-N-acetylglucosamine diphosphorylase / glucose-1-phosphate thymidylyltransferase / UDP-N-acetylgalactosamine diphosphorylase / glucosamine-1-phosphate N-acetyltransferase / galactosamine-1-phosphate N-acetyltransferase
MDFRWNSTNNKMIDLTRFIKNFNERYPSAQQAEPWEITATIQQVVVSGIKELNDNYTVRDNIAIHKSAKIEEHVVIKGPAIISGDCFIAAHAYLRGGVFIDENVIIGPGCEVKSSVIFSHSALAHFNFVGDSLIGSNVNKEAGAVIANHYNERREKMISVLTGGKIYKTGVTKFGALIGDRSRIGANAVLSPGTILEPESIVARLALVTQCL